MKRWEIYLEILCEIFMILAVLFGIGYVLPKTLAFLWPLVAGWIIALLAQPLRKFLERKIRVSKRFGSAMIIIAVIMVVSTALFFIGAKIGHESMQLAKGLPEMYTEMKDTVEDTWEKVSVKLPKKISEKVEDASGKITKEVSEYLAGSRGINYAKSIAKSVTNGLIGIVVMFMSAYFFLADKEKINEVITKLEAPELKRRMKLVKDNIIGALGGYFIAQLKIMGIIFILLLIGFLVLSVDYALIFALLICILDALPFFGVGTALIPWAIYDFAKGDMKMGICLLVLYIICLLTRQILQPKIVGQSVGLDPLLTLILMYIGMKVAGILGFIIAVILGIIMTELYRLGMFDSSIERMKLRFEMLKDAQ